MPSVGAPVGFDGFDLFGQWVDATSPRLTIEAGNLAGSSLDMMSAVRHAHKHLGVSLSEAIFMATLGPAQAIGLGATLGKIATGNLANLIHISDDGNIERSWINGEELHVCAPDKTTGVLTA